MWAKSLFFSVLALAAATAAPAAAFPAPGPDIFQPQWVMPAQDRGDRQRQELRPLREIVDSLRGRYGGDLISARLEDGSQPIYVLRWRMPDGQVRDFRVDAVSGRPR